MRCREAKRLLNEGDLTSQDLAEHIRNCPDCAREAKAAGIILDSFDTLRRQSQAAPTPLSDIRTRVESHPAGSTEKEYSRMAEVTHKMAARKKLGFGLGLAVAALLFFVLVPFSYDRVVGYDVEISGIPVGQMINISPINRGLAGLGYDMASVSANYTSDGATLSITNLPDMEAAQKASAVVSTLTGLELTAEYIPRVEAVSGSLYAQVTDNLFSVKITASGHTLEEIEASIEAELAKMGFSGCEAMVTREGDQMMLQIGIPGDALDAQPGQPVEIQIDVPCEDK